MKRLKLLVLASLLLTLTLVLVPPARAQNNRASKQFIYTVQRGDTLVLIALHYNLRLADIIFANNLADPNLIFPGQKLLLPEVVGDQSEPSEPPFPTAGYHTVQAGESLFSVAGEHGVTVGALILANNITDPDLIEVGQRLEIPAGVPEPGPLTAPFTEITLSEPVIIQGRTLAIQVVLSEPASLTGSFEGRPLFFEESSPNQLWSIIPIHALADHNDYPIMLTATLADGTEVKTFRNVTVVEGPYGVEEIRLNGSRGELLDEDLIKAEREKLAGLWSQITSQPRWNGPFRYPVVSDSLRITSYFGTRRSYNGSTAPSFHGGVDFGGEVGTPVYAAAAGTVVLADKLTLRGNAVLVDHGLGLFSGYWHQSQLAVVEGQEVAAGDLIGYLGNTGLATGPHLHWEMRLYGIAVDPTQWVQQSIP